jgi:hypothetical protein
MDQTTTRHLDQADEGALTQAFSDEVLEAAAGAERLAAGATMVGGLCGFTRDMCGD